MRTDGTPMPADEYPSVRALKEHRRVGNVEMGTVKDHGDISWISVTAAPLPLEGYGVVIAFGDITERKRAEDELTRSHDLLANLARLVPGVIYQYRLYPDRLFEGEMARLDRGRRFPVSIVMADLNHLKVTNDRDGHAAGDVLLQRCAEILSAAFRAEDVIARIGGDEFAVLLPDTDVASAEQSLRRVRGALHEHNAAFGGTPLSIAFGVSTAEQGVALTEALKEADARMYYDKQGC